MTVAPLPPRLDRCTVLAPRTSDGTMHGSVTTLDGSPLPATVTIDGAGVILAVVTDERGTFGAPVHRGRYTVSALTETSETVNITCAPVEVASGEGASVAIVVDP